MRGLRQLQDFFAGCRERNLPPRCDPHVSLSGRQKIARLAAASQVFSPAAASGVCHSAAPLVSGLQGGKNYLRGLRQPQKLFGAALARAESFTALRTADAMRPRRPMTTGAKERAVNDFFAGCRERNLTRPRGSPHLAIAGCGSLHIAMFFKGLFDLAFRHAEK